MPPLPACLWKLSRHPEPSDRRSRAARNRRSRPCRRGSAPLSLLRVSARSILSFAARTSHPPAPRAANVQKCAKSEQITSSFSIGYKLPLAQTLSFDTLTNCLGGCVVLVNQKSRGLHPSLRRARNFPKFVHRPIRDDHDDPWRPRRKHAPMPHHFGIVARTQLNRLGRRLASSRGCSF